MSSFAMKTASLIAHMNGGTLFQEAKRDPQATISNRLSRARNIWLQDQAEAQMLVAEAKQVAVLHKLPFVFVAPGRKSQASKKPQ